MEIFFSVTRYIQTLLIIYAQSLCCFSLITNHWPTQTGNLSFHFHGLILCCELNFKLNAISTKGCWIPDLTISRLSLPQRDSGLVLIFFSPFANPLLSEVWWQHHNFSINFRSSKFPHDWKPCSTTRNCLPFVIHQREWKLGWQERDFSCVFKLTWT